MKDLPMLKKSHDIVNRIHVGEGGVDRILLYYLHTLVLKIIAEKFVPGEKIADGNSVRKIHFEVT